MARNSSWRGWRLGLGAQALLASPLLQVALARASSRDVGGDADQAMTGLLVGSGDLVMRKMFPRRALLDVMVSPLSSPGGRCHRSPRRCGPLSSTPGSPSAGAPAVAGIDQVGGAGGDPFRQRIALPQRGLARSSAAVLRTTRWSSSV